MTNKTKKAQMEILGLAVVVAILIIGGFVLMRLLAQEPTNTKTNDRQIATAFVNTLLSERLEADCKEGIALKDMIKDCTTPKDLQRQCTDGTSYCEKSKNAVQEILTQTFEARKKGYEFRLKTESGTIQQFGTLSKGCGPTSNKETSVFSIPTDRETIFPELKLCQQ